LQIRDSWRSLEQAKRNYEISEVGVRLAERRVEEQELLAEFGRAKALDQVDAQNSLLSSKDQLTQALVTHTIARLQFWDNMGILYIKEDGQWEDMEEPPRSANASGSRQREEADANEPSGRHAMMAASARTPHPGPLPIGWGEGEDHTRQVQGRDAPELSSVGELREQKRQRPAALQDTVATDRVPLLPRGLGVRLSSAALPSNDQQAPSPAPTN
jgi:hypothetical protein